MEDYCPARCEGCSSPSHTMSENGLSVEILVKKVRRTDDPSKPWIYNWQTRSLNYLRKLKGNVGKHVVVGSKLWIRCVDIKPGSYESSINKVAE